MGIKGANQLTFRQGDYLELSWLSLTMVLKSGKGMQANQRWQCEKDSFSVAGFEDGRMEPQTKECSQILEAGKGKGTDFCPRTARRGAEYLGFSTIRPISTAKLQTIHLYCFYPLTFS